MLKALASLLPLGALGISVALAATPAKAAATDSDTEAAGVAARLQVIRAAVSDITAQQTGLQPGDPNIVKAWWGNWRPGWGNGGWRNWGNGWRNGGWGNWGNGWHNGGWHNWRNFWNNW